MGYLSNPVGLRLGKNRAWLIKGTTNVYHQNEHLHNFLYLAIKSFFRRKRFRYMGFIFSHITWRYPNLVVNVVDARFERLYMKADRKSVV